MAKKNSYEGVDRTMQNAAQTLLANIRFASVDDPVRSIVMTSSIPNEGKTTISIELAKAMAKGGRTVLLVECDMRRRSLAAELNVHPQNGLYAVLSGTVDLAGCATPIEKNLWFLDVEPHIPNPPDIIASKRFRRFVEDAKARFNFVVFDTPPLTAFVDAAVLSSVADGTVMVVRENFAKRSEVQDAYAQLENAGANVLGVAMNYCREERSEYYYAYYDKMGNRVKGHEHGGETPQQDNAVDDPRRPLPQSTVRRGPPVAAPSRSELHAAFARTAAPVAAGSADSSAPMPVNRTRPAARRGDQ